MNPKTLKLSVDKKTFKKAKKGKIKSFIRDCNWYWRKRLSGDFKSVLLHVGMGADKIVILKLNKIRRKNDAFIIKVG